MQHKINFYLHLSKEFVIKKINIELVTASNSISVQIAELSTELSRSFEAVSRVFRYEALDTILFSLFHSARSHSAGLGASIDQLIGASTHSFIHAVASDSSFPWNSFSITQ